MGEIRDKARNAAQEVKGNMKEAVGKATDDEELEAKGKGDKAAANVKQVGEKIKDVVR